MAGIYSQNREMLDKGYDILKKHNGNWIGNADLARILKVKPVQIRKQLERSIRDNTYEDFPVERRKLNAKVVEWRVLSTPSAAIKPAVEEKAKPKPKKKAEPREDLFSKVEKYEDGDYLLGLAEMLGQRESYRKALRSIGRILYEEFGDVKLSEL